MTTHFGMSALKVTPCAQRSAISMSPTLESSSYMALESMWGSSASALGSIGLMWPVPPLRSMNMPRNGGLTAVSSAAKTPGRLAGSP